MGSQAIHAILSGWGRGRRMNAAPNDYKSQAAFAKLMVNPGDSTEPDKHPPLADTMHGIVDRAVSSMYERKPRHYEITCRAYISLEDDHVIASAMRLSRSTVRTFRIAAEAWVESRLYDDEDGFS